MEFFNEFGAVPTWPWLVTLNDLIVVATKPKHECSNAAPKSGTPNMKVWKMFLFISG